MMDHPRTAAYLGLSAVLALWIIGYGSLHLLAAHRFRDFLSSVMTGVMERRVPARAEQASASATTQQPE